MPLKPEDAELLAEFGVRITQYRHKRNLSQSHLAKYAGLTRASIANIEAGKQNCSITALVGIAAALGVIPGALLGGHPGAAKPEWADQVRRHTQQRMTADIEGFLASYTLPEEGP
jgi:transcriptional regulator with XRE-family HTH domain